MTSTLILGGGGGGGDWQNICIIGDFEYTMYDFLVEELLQGNDADSSLQTVEQNILDEPIAE